MSKLEQIGAILDKHYDTKGPAHDDLMSEITSTMTELSGISADLNEHDRRFNRAQYLRGLAQIYLDAGYEEGTRDVNADLKDYHETLGEQYGQQTPTLVLMGNPRRRAFKLDTYSQNALRRIFKAIPLATRDVDGLKEGAIKKFELDMRNAPDEWKIRVDAWSGPVLDYLSSARWDVECSERGYQNARLQELEKDIQAMMVPHRIYGGREDNNVRIGTELTGFGKRIYHMFIAAIGEDEGWEMYRQAATMIGQNALNIDAQIKEFREEPTLDVREPHVPGETSIHEHTQFDDMLDPEEDDPDAHKKSFGQWREQQGRRNEQIVEFAAFIDDCLFDDITTFEETKKEAFATFNQMKKEILEVAFNE